MTQKIITTTQQTAVDEGEFNTPVEAAAWVAGVVLTYQDAAEVYTTVKRVEARDPSSSGFFSYFRTVWKARVEAFWPKDRKVETALVEVDMTKAAEALEKIDTFMKGIVSS